MHAFQRPTAVSGKWVALNYLNTSFVCITGLVSALWRCSNGLDQIMHSPLAHALSWPRPLLHRPRALIKPRNAHTLVFIYLQLWALDKAALQLGTSPSKEWIGRERGKEIINGFLLQGSCWSGRKYSTSKAR